MKKKTAVGRWVVVGNERYGLYYGRITATDAEIAATMCAEGPKNE